MADHRAMLLNFRRAALIGVSAAAALPLVGCQTPPPKQPQASTPQYSSSRARAEQAANRAPQAQPQRRSGRRFAANY